nr:hypothetical protein [Tanacetum cinerariifolium]
MGEEHVADDAVYKELDDILVRAATTASSLEAEQDIGNINKTQSKATPNEAGSLRTTSGGGPRTSSCGGPMCQEAMRDTIAQTRFENVSKKLMIHCSQEDASKQERRIDDIDADEDITLVNDQVDAEIFDVSDLGGEEVFVAEQDVVSTDATTVTAEELTLAQALEALMTSKPKVRGIVIQEQEEPEKATLFMQFLKKRRKFFTAKRAKEKRNKPQHNSKEKIMCTYLKSMEGCTLKQLKEFEFDKVQEMFDKAFKTVNTFEDFRIELLQGQENEKRAREELIQKRAKKQKVEDDKEITELKQLKTLEQNWCKDKKKKKKREQEKS